MIRSSPPSAQMTSSPAVPRRTSLPSLPTIEQRTTPPGPRGNRVVVNVCVMPVVVPAALAATIRKTKLVPSARPCSVAETSCGAVTGPRAYTVVRRPKLDPDPYSTYQLVASPFGLIVVITVAEVGPIALGPFDSTAGGATVVSVESDPRVVPASL